MTVDEIALKVPTGGQKTLIRQPHFYEIPFKGFSEEVKWDFGEIVAS